jgi:hypothetical protein
MCVWYSIVQVCHCAEFAADMRFGAGPRLIVGATDGKLIVGGIVGSPDNVACDVDDG